MGWMSGDVVDEESLVVDGEHEDPHDGPVALRDGHVMVADDLFVVVDIDITWAERE